jgi:D-amino-acid dehydrogenase
MTRGAVVIGGGVIGAMSAYHLAKAGWRVTVLDRGRFGGACSHGNCGYVCPSHVLPMAGPGAIISTLKTLLQKNSPLKVRPSAVLKSLGWFLRFARRCNRRDQLSAAVGIRAMLVASKAMYDGLIRDEKLECEWDTSGLLFVFRSKAVFDHYAEVDELLRTQFATSARRFDADQLRATEPALKPGSASGGYLYECDAQLRPDRLMSELRRVLTAAGVTIVENRSADIRIENGKAIAVGDVPADAVVVAAGALSPSFSGTLGCRIPIIPGKGYSVTFDRPANAPRHPLIFEEHRVAVSPFQSGYRIGSTMEFAGYDETLNRDRLKLLTDGAALYLDRPTGPPREEWWGWRPMVADGLPIIDFAPAAKNVVIAAGHGMLGLSMATGTGKLVADLLCGDKPHVDPTPYSLWSVGVSSQPQHVRHRVRPRRLARQVLRRGQRPSCIAVPAVSFVDQFQRLAERREDDRVFAHVVPAADGVDADLAERPFADQPFTAVADGRLSHRLLHDPGEVSRGAGRRVLLVPVVPLDDLDIEPLVGERLGRQLGQLEQQVHHQAHARRIQHGRLVGRSGDLTLLVRLVPGGGDDDRQFPPDARLQDRQRPGRGREVDHHLRPGGQRQLGRHRHAEVRHAGQFAGVRSQLRVPRGIDRGDEFQRRVFGGQGDESLAHPATGPVDRNRRSVHVSPFGRDRVLADQVIGCEDRGPFDDRLGD